MECCERTKDKQPIGPINYYKVIELYMSIKSDHPWLFIDTDNLNGSCLDRFEAI